jgi:hypothetical protein
VVRLPKRPEPLGHTQAQIEEILNERGPFLPLADSKAAAKKQTWAEMVTEGILIGDEGQAPKDFSSTFGEHLYGARVEW